MKRTYYLDYAATSAVRPPEVADAVAAYLRDVGATPGRSGHARALEAGRLALRCRRLLAELFGIPGDPGRVAFQANATHALNTALYGLLSPGDVVVRTMLDHNAVRRPIAALAETGVIARVLPMDLHGGFDRKQLRRLLDEPTAGRRVLATTHASNVTGAVLPIAEMSDIAHEVGAVVVLDAAQTAGHHALDVQQLGIDLLAFTGHKGLLGPQGTGGLWVRPGLDVKPLLRGGTGGDSAPAEMPESYPDHLEAGTQNAPGIAGLVAGLEWIGRQGVERLRAREMELKNRLIDGLRSIPAVRICSTTRPDSVGIVTVVVEGLDAAALAGALDRDYGVQGRAGLHCAPDAHQVMGTYQSGAFRMSLGWATDEEDIDQTVHAFRALSGEKADK